MLIPFSDYIWINWVFLLNLILFSLGALYTFSIYLIAGTRSHLYLMLFHISGVILLISNLHVASLTADGTSRLYASFDMLGNKIGWLGIYLVGLEMIKGTNRDLPRFVKSALHLNAAVVFIWVLYTLFLTPGPWNVPQELFTDFFSVYTFYIYSILNTGVFLYAIISTKSLNKRAGQVRILWMLAINTWTVWYIVVLPLTLIGSSFSFLIPFALYLISSICVVYIIFFIPENLFISKNVVLEARGLYETIQKHPDEIRIFGSKGLKDYLLSLPDDIFEGTTQD